MNVLHSLTMTQSTLRKVFAAPLCKHSKSFLTPPSRSMTAAQADKIQGTGCTHQTVHTRVLGGSINRRAFY